ncbi:hypothetical protein OG249_13580 [Streptomyces microflavus]|uniref:hypothetical protein n=1 Tax=Streptomyces microflavus TaxID=1919 RepID=UPI00225B167B|nr:hypothetical protein [Streptomyces microflavus]MCX4652921.1 hypothetical protein [Streptomyces microflavus]
MQESRPPEYDQVSIVFVGSFNPKIYQPAWFEAQGLIRPEEAADSKIEVISNDICIFETSWFRLEVFKERWALSSRATPAIELLRDLVLATFETLRHSPVTKIGINAHGHYSMPNRETLDKFGHAVAPKDSFWRPVMEDPRLLTLTIVSKRTDGHEGAVRAKVEPSGRITDGLFVEVNDEYANDDSVSAEWAIKIVSEEWENHRSRVTSIRENIVTEAWGMR